MLLACWAAIVQSLSLAGRLQQRPPASLCPAADHMPAWLRRPLALRWHCVLRDGCPPTCVVVCMRVAALFEGCGSSSLHVCVCCVPFALHQRDASSHVIEYTPDFSPKVGGRPCGRSAPNAPLVPTVDDALVVNPYAERWYRQFEHLQETP